MRHLSSGALSANRQTLHLKRKSDVLTVQVEQDFVRRTGSAFHLVLLHLRAVSTFAQCDALDFFEQSHLLKHQ